MFQLKICTWATANFSEIIAPDFLSLFLSFSLSLFLSFSLSLFLSFSLSLFLSFSLFLFLSSSLPLCNLEIESLFGFSLSLGKKVFFSFLLFFGFGH
jgi:hypothetical protein